MSPRVLWKSVSTGLFCACAPADIVPLKKVFEETSQKYQINNQKVSLCSMFKVLLYRKLPLIGPGLIQLRKGF